MGPTDGGEVEPRGLGLQGRGRTPTVDGGMEADTLGGREGGRGGARNTTSSHGMWGAVAAAGHQMPPGIRL